MLIRPIRQTQKSGAYANAVVEEISLGYATVRLAKNGARLTRLPVLGGAVSEGENVIVDWSAGVPPLVRPITTPYPEDEIDLSEGRGEAMNEIQSDVSFKVSANTPQLIGTSFSKVDWGAAEWQTEAFFSTGDPSVITLPADGFYYITAQVGVQGFVDWRSMMPTLWSNEYSYDKVEAFKKKTAAQRVYGELRGSEVGTFGFNIGDTMDMEPSVVTTMEVHGMMAGVLGEEITLWLKHTDPGRDNIDLKIDPDGMYPQIWGFRMTRGGFTDAGAFSYGTTPGTGVPGAPTSGGGGEDDDDSDIEIQTNMGYLHVSDEASQTYARGIARVGDWLSLELTLDLEFDDVDNGATLRLQLRSTRDWDNWETPTRCYEMSINNTGGFGLHSVEGGVRTNLASENRGATTLPHKIRFRADGTSIKAKMWLASESEPGWDLEVAGGFSDAGGLQLGYFNSVGDHKIHIDNLYLDVP